MKLYAWKQFCKLKLIFQRYASICIILCDLYRCEHQRLKDILNLSASVKSQRKSICYNLFVATSSLVNSNLYTFLPIEVGLISSFKTSPVGEYSKSLIGFCIGLSILLSFLGNSQNPSLVRSITVHVFDIGWYIFSVVVGILKNTINTHAVFFSVSEHLSCFYKQQSYTHPSLSIF